MTPQDPAALARHACYTVLIALAVGIAAAKVVGAENVFEPSRYKPPTPDAYGAGVPNEPERRWPETRPNPAPMFGSNDRSRWATVRALVDEGTYVIGRRTNFADGTGPWDDRGIIFEDGYQSLDKVMDPDTGLFYSSKPPLFPTALAGEYWLLKHLFGWSIVADRWWVVCTILLTVNVLPFAAFLVLMSRLVEDYGATDFGRVFTVAAACGGTFLTTFAVTLNNHTPAACCALFAVYPLLSKRGRPPLESPTKLALSGFFAALTATLELPALALVAALFVPLLIAAPRRALLFFLPGATIPAFGFFLTNYAAIDRLLPAYGEFGGPWYNYPGSHWARAGTPAAKGIDFADEPKHVYAFHFLFGHHGWFSLTPVWLLGAAGLIAQVRAGGPEVRRLLMGRVERPVWSPHLLGTATSAVTAVVVAFYIVKSNNYGGFTSAPRWLIWLTPLWLLGTLPGADWAGRSAAGRWACAVLLGLSALSAFYPAWNPWRPPWILQLAELMGWVKY